MHPGGQGWQMVLETSVLYGGEQHMGSGGDSDGWWTAAVSKQIQRGLDVSICEHMEL